MSSIDLKLTLIPISQNLPAYSQSCAPDLAGFPLSDRPPFFRQIVLTKPSGECKPHPDDAGPRGRRRDWHGRRRADRELQDRYFGHRQARRIAIRLGCREAPPHWWVRSQNNLNLDKLDLAFPAFCCPIGPACPTKGRQEYAGSGLGVQKDAVAGRIGELMVRMLFSALPGGGLGQANLAPLKNGSRATT